MGKSSPPPPSALHVRGNDTCEIIPILIHPKIRYSSSLYLDHLVCNFVHSNLGWHGNSWVWVLHFAFASTRTPFVTKYIETMLNGLDRQRTNQHQNPTRFLGFVLFACSWLRSLECYDQGRSCRSLATDCGRCQPRRNKCKLTDCQRDNNMTIRSQHSWLLNMSVYDAPKWNDVICYDKKK